MKAIYLVVLFVILSVSVLAQVVERIEIREYSYLDTIPKCGNNTNMYVTFTHDFYAEFSTRSVAIDTISTKLVNGCCCAVVYRNTRFEVLKVTTKLSCATCINRYEITEEHFGWLLIME